MVLNNTPSPVGIKAAEGDGPHPENRPPGDVYSPGEEPISAPETPPRRTSPAKGPPVYFLCPDLNIPSGGLKRIYRIAQVLHRAGFRACVLHEKTGFHQDWIATGAPLRYADALRLEPGDVVVIPETLPETMKTIPDYCRKVVQAFSWTYIFENLREGETWRDYNVEMVVTPSRVIADFIRWTLGLPVQCFGTGIDHDLYQYRPAVKEKSIAFLTHRNLEGERVKKIFAQLPRGLPSYQWIGMTRKREEDYANVLRKSRIFLATGIREGVPGPILEAMACGTIVVGYRGVGGNEYLLDEGPDKNFFGVENGDYFALSRALEMVMGLVEGDDPLIGRVIENGLETVRDLTFEREAASIVECWNAFLDKRPGPSMGEDPGDGLVQIRKKLAAKKLVLPYSFVIELSDRPFLPAGHDTPSGVEQDCRRMPSSLWETLALKIARYREAAPNLPLSITLGENREPLLNGEIFSLKGPRRVLGDIPLSLTTEGHSLSRELIDRLFGFNLRVLTIRYRGYDESSHLERTGKDPTDLLRNIDFIMTRNPDLLEILCPLPPDFTQERERAGEFWRKRGVSRVLFQPNGNGLPDTAAPEGMKSPCALPGKANYVSCRGLLLPCGRDQGEKVPLLDLAKGDFIQAAIAKNEIYREERVFPFCSGCRVQGRWAFHELVFADVE